ncbi:outer membrane protein [Vibrio sinus]
MKKLVTSTLLVTGLSVAGVSSAFAGSSYFSGSMGMGYQSVPVLSNTGVSTSSDVQPAYSFSYGYESDVQNNWSGGLEGGYTYFGTANVSSTAGNVKARTAAWDFAGFAAYHVNKQWSIFGKGGMALMFSSINYDGNGHNNDSSEFNPLLGAGVRYNVNEQLSFDASTTHYFGDTASSVGNSQALGDSRVVPSITTFMVGVQYKFK